MKIIAIIGFGFSGRLAFHHLVKNSDKNTKILIFDKNGQSALGPAFSGFSPHYILNIPAKNMSAFSDAQNDFCEFLQKKYPQIWQEIGEDGFAPRQIYGEYLDEITKKDFENAEKNAVEFEFVSEEVAKILKQVQDDGGDCHSELQHRHAELVSGSFSITTKNQNSYQANEILLAISFTQSDLTLNLPTKNIVKKLWNEEALPFHQQKFTDEKICLIGCGLTAVDVIAGLKKENFSGKIFAISRRGNFPKKHLTNSNSKTELVISAADAKNGVIFLCQKIRQFLRANPQFDLRHVIDSIRFTTQKIWQNLDEKNKKNFLKHLWSYWNIFRHRAPISSIEIIEKMIATKQLEIITLQQIQNNKKIEFDYVVNCLGFELSAEKYPLLQQMIEHGLLKKDALLAQSNHPKIYLLGGLNIGRDFECTAVPDLRVSVENYFVSA